MNVAIMGAGLAGLSCALMLERHGISPAIFEKRSMPGDRFINGEAFISLLTSPVTDCFRYFSEEFNLHLRPSSHINKISFLSENNQAVIKEPAGTMNLRGRHRLALENQLAEQISSKITFHSEVSYEELMKNFTHVILATGDASYALQMENYTKDFSVSLKGATVEGEFEPNGVMVWLNNDFAPKGYAYLMPFSKREANIVIAFPDSPQLSQEKVAVQWDKFYKAVCTELRQDLKITDQFHIHDYEIGICKSPRLGNTFMTGNCFGAVMPFLGFGQFAALLTGIYAAYDICGFGKYEEYTKPLRKSYFDSLTLRRGMEKLDNHSFDLVVHQLNGWLGKKLFQTDKNVVKMMSMLLNPFVRD
ncbi:NAD(P)/FAD-dependent oxidoreductase [Alteribacillus sp. HJP-4]|uniref:NAD(P)/FAD-dependent oxidoreductase n=1 Tax=Alteribacillus sp. HJP-4 TaxID=2775394 RepID=UPI0035CCD419